METKREHSHLSVNRFVDDEEVHDVETHPYDPKTAERQIARTRRVRAEREAAKHNALMEKLIAVAKDARQNIMPITIAAVDNGATMGEIVDALKKLWGTYSEMPVFDVRDVGLCAGMRRMYRSLGR